MWLHRRKDKDGDGSTSTNVVSSENISPPATLDQHHKKSSTSTNSQRKDEKKPSGIRKKILQLGGFGHHQQPATDGSSVKLSSSELKRLEQTKQLLFKQTSPTNYCEFLYDVFIKNTYNYTDRHMCVFAQTVSKSRK